jgi:glycosyltransferase involved in cell wall biosynthesis
MVSVVIPCYNQGRFLGEAIDSVLAQTHRSFEIIVVDDGSTDDTVEVAGRYNGVRCFSQANQGQGAARNLGLTHVTGEYVVFLDADDRLLPDAFEIGLRHLEAHPDCAFTAGRCLVLGPDGVRRERSYGPVVVRDHYLMLLRNNYIWMPGTVLFRTAIVREVGGFKTTVSGAEDYDLYLRIAQRHRIWCHDQMVAEYRQHETNTSRRPMLMIRSSLKVMYGQRALIRGNAEAERAWRHGFQRWQDDYGEQLITAVRMQVRAGEWRLAIAGLARLLQYHPRGVLRHASRKLHRVARGRRPETLDAPAQQQSPGSPPRGY